MGESYLIDQNKIATGVELEIISPNEQELKIDALVGCFVNKCNFNLNEVVYVSNQIIYSKQPLEISKFALLQFRDQQSRIFYSMNRMPFNLNS